MKNDDAVFYLGAITMGQASIDNLTCGLKNSIWYDIDNIAYVLYAKLRNLNLG
jgi:hypothetical protein